MKGYVCKICGFISINGSAPDKCPVCGAPKTAFEEKDAIKMSPRYLAGETLRELSQEFPYRKFQIACIIASLHGINSTSGPVWRYGFRNKHREAKGRREADSCPV